jgi:hypothetical protein
MRILKNYLISAIAFSVILSSCSTVEQASTHGLNSGYYKLKSVNNPPAKVYLDVTEEKMEVYLQTNRQPEKKSFLTIPLKDSNSPEFSPLVFKKHSLDIDITSVLLKYRPQVNGLPSQLTTDLNMALFAGWRYDRFHLKSKRDPLGKAYTKMNSLGFDFGLLAGPGATLLSPFTTNNKRVDEYSGMIFQTGMAAFIESNVASFGLAIGYDYLLNADRNIWIYQNKPWMGFVVGIALN